MAGRLSDVVQELDRAIQLALADGPRGVVCDLSGVHVGAEPGAREILAAAGKHVRDWSGAPVVVASRDPQVRNALCAGSLGGHLIVTTTVLTAVYAMRTIPAPTVQKLPLGSHPTTPRASRNFVTRTLLDWRLGRVISSACLVVSELVTDSTTHAGTDIDLSMAWNLGALRLTVRDVSPCLPHQQHPGLKTQGRGLTIVAGLSRAFGALPTANGGRVVWAVLDAPRPRSSTSPRRLDAATKESPKFTVACPLLVALDEAEPEADLAEVVAGVVDRTGLRVSRWGRPGGGGWSEQLRVCHRGVFGSSVVLDPGVSPAR